MASAFAAPATAQSPEELLTSSPHRYTAEEEAAKPDGGAPPSDPWSPNLEAASPSARQAAPTPNEALGDTGAYTFQEYWLDGDDGYQAIKVNVGSGNLFLRAKMGEVSGPGVPAVAYRVYNSQNDIGRGYLGSWTEDYEITGLDISSSQVTYYDGTGARWTFTGSGNTWTEPAGLNAKLTKNTNGTWQLAYNRTGEKIQFNTTGWPTDRQDRNGTGIRYGWEGDRVVAIRDAVDKRLTFDYYAIDGGSGDRLASVNNGLISSTWFNYDSAKRLNVVDGQYADRATWNITYDSAGRVASLAGATRTIAFEYDTTNRVTKTTQSQPGQASIVTQFAYTATGTVGTDPRGNTVTYDIDDKWRVTKTTDQLGRSQSQTWTANSDVATTTDGFSTGGGTGNVTTATYDQLNNQSGLTLPTGAASQAIYAQGPTCPNGQSGNPYRAKCTIDASGNSHSLTYDGAGNLTADTDTTAGGTGASTSYTYESAAGTVCGAKAGQVCSSTDGNGKVTNYAYTNGNLTKVTPPAPLGVTSYEYDTRARLTKVTDGNGDVTTFSYDAADRVKVTTFDNGATLTNTWNLDGTLAKEVDSAAATTITYAYGLLGKQTKKQVQAPTGAGLSATVAMAYDANGNMTSNDASGAVTTFTYDAANQVTKMVEAGGTCPATGNPAAGSKCVLFNYDNNGKETARTYPGGARQDTTRDASGRPTQIIAKDAGGTTRANIAYSYALAGADRVNVQTRTSNAEEGIPAGAVTTYSYDSLDRLTSAQEKVGAAVNASWTYAYDKAGNRTSQVRSGSTGAAAGSVSYTYNAANQVATTTADTTTWAYDGAGNQTRNGITGQTATYGDRLQVTANGATTYTTFGQGNEQQLKAGASAFLSTDIGLARRADATSSVTWQRKSEGGAVGFTAGGAPHYFATDHLGSVVGIFSAAGAWEGGYSYSPYGERRASGAGAAVTSNNIRFAGGYEESANFYKLGARYYDSTLARFTQFDPAGQESNPYAYANSNPCNAVDPTGTISRSCALALGGFALGTVGLFAGMAGGPFTFGLGVASYAASVLGVMDSCY